jgi:hypothetical protein
MQIGSVVRSFPTNIIKAGSNETTPKAAGAFRNGVKLNKRNAKGGAGMGFKAGDKCTETGLYVCQNCQSSTQEKYVKEGDTFPPCSHCRSNADWIRVGRG